MFATAVEQIAESVMITDRTGVIEYVNPAFERISGYTRKDVLGKRPNILKSGKQNEGFYKTLWDTISRGDVWRGYITNKKKDGSLYDVEMSISPIRDAAGAIVNYVSVKRDITGERRLESQLLQAQKMEAVATMADGLAHDFNNIVTAIIGFTDLITDEVPEGTKAHRRLGYVRDAGIRARELVKEMLRFSRKAEVGKKCVAIGPLVKEILKLLKASTPPTIEIRETIEPEAEPMVADPVQIQQVVMNLCTNAIHAMRECGGVLDVALTQVELDRPPHPDLAPGAYLELRVADTGCGMDSSTIQRIFDPFFTTKKPDEGTGLGLAVVEGIVKNHKGAVTVASEPGKGSVFTVFLPLTQCTQASADTTNQ